MDSFPRSLVRGSQFSSSASGGEKIGKTWVEISKRALLHNVGQFLSLLPAGVQFMAVVKSNAYGHGLPEITQILRDNYSRNSRHAVHSRNPQLWFGVDNLNEAAVVHELAPRNPVLVLGYTQNARLREAAKLGVRITAYNWETVKALKRLQTTDYRLRLHVKVETGTTRQGIPEIEVVEVVKSLRKLKGVEVEGISTHFANIEDTASTEYAKSQLKRYSSVIMRLKRAGIEIPLKHTACTAATLLHPETYGNLVRVGIGLYGLWPSHEVRIRNQELGIRKVDLQPVLTWKTIVAQVKNVKKGTPVSYGLTERVRRNSHVAVLPIGYWDGYDRGLTQIGHVLVGGKRCKVLGRVCMNMTIVDVTEVGRVCPEDEVVLIGRQGRGEITAEELAEKLNTINYEIVTRINSLIPRIII